MLYKLLESERVCSGICKDEGLYAHLWDIQEKSCNWKVNV